MYLLRTFGGLTLTHASTHQTVGAARRKPLALLAIVAASGERGVERDGIATMLWPELDEARARRALSQTLYALRRELGEDVLRDLPRLTVDPTKLASDAGEFQSLARPGGTRRDLERAAALYAGPYLDGVHFPGCVEFEHWTEMSRAFHAASYLGVLREIARLAAGAADTPRAIEWLERAAREFPLDSDVASALAQAYADAGRHGQAYAFLNAHFAALQAELGTAPPAHLVSLGRELQTAPTATSTSRSSSAETSAAEGRKTSVTNATATSSRARAVAAERPERRPARGIGALARGGNRLVRVGGGIAAAVLGVTAAAWAFRWKPAEPAPESLSAAFATEMAPSRQAGRDNRVLLRVATMPLFGREPESATALATYVDDVLRPALAGVAALVPREQNESLQDRLVVQHAGARAPFIFTPQLFEISDAELAIEAAVVDMGRRSDSIGLGITLYRRAVVPPCPEGWVRLGMSKDAVDTGSYDGIETWSSFRLRAPKARPTKSVDSLVRSAKRMLESLNSCDLDAHRGATTAPWCWAGPGRVSVVPGVLRARLSAGEDITMSMTTNRVPGGRGRYCIYSAGGRISSS